MEKQVVFCNIMVWLQRWGSHVTSMVRNPLCSPAGLPLEICIGLAIWKAQFR